MGRKGQVLINNIPAGIISEGDEGYIFQYSSEYFTKTENKPVSLSLPLQKEPYVSKTMFPFFDGLIPEGWLLDIAGKIWKLDPRDRMGILISCCKDCIGAVSVIPLEKPEDK